MTLLTILLSILIVAALFAAMAIGVLMGRPPIKGSCGGLGAVGIKENCEFCGGRPERCPETAQAAGGPR
jgi:uncharacterized protein